ncbi:PCTP-like protein-like protein [Corchorus olitorius]|uniref:PCTP-like protein-like protein n=1 Tax=Corchorus olitorius TaxID=93759 RepID=A0A1R3JQG0_9ROSI|nr:PCTP-like protein-like protein [Corchorus olitorius]
MADNAENVNPNMVVRFERTPQTRFFMCRSCKNHLLSLQNQLFRDQGLHAIICQNAVNVSVEHEDSSWTFNHHPVLRTPLPTRAIQEGRILLYLDKMLYWDGNQVVYADTLQPAED